MVHPPPPGRTDSTDSAYESDSEESLSSAEGYICAQKAEVGGLSGSRT